METSDRVGHDRENPGPGGTRPEDAGTQGARPAPAHPGAAGGDDTGTDHVGTDDTATDDAGNENAGTEQAGADRADREDTCLDDAGLNGIAGSGAESDESDRDGADRDGRLAEQLLRLTRRLHRIQKHQLGPVGITPAQGRLLRTVAYCVSDRGGPPRMSDLAARLEVVPRAVTTLVDGLEASGWVRRAPDPTNRRVIRIELTDSGLDTLRSLRTARHSAAEEMLAPLSGAQRETLGDLLSALIDAPDAPGRPVPPKSHTHPTTPSRPAEPAAGPRTPPVPPSRPDGPA